MSFQEKKKKKNCSIVYISGDFVLLTLPWCSVCKESFSLSAPRWLRSCDWFMTQIWQHPGCSSERKPHSYITVNPSAVLHRDMLRLSFILSSGDSSSANSEDPQGSLNSHKTLRCV